MTPGRGENKEALPCVAQRDPQLARAPGSGSLKVRAVPMTLLSTRNVDVSFTESTLSLAP